MQSQRFLANYKCECYGLNYCNCKHKSVANAVFLENIYNVADALAQVMVICGIHQCKAKAAVDVIIYSFLHYDEIRHRVDAVPRKRLCKEDLIHDLGRKCLMNRLEAQLAYSIIKRAFKAFYHGTSEGGIRNPILEAQLVHSQECLWVHAAKRTAQIFASYEGMFYSAQKNYEAQIKCVYKRLYDQMKERADPVMAEECDCRSCVKRAVVDMPKLTKSLFSMHDGSSQQNKSGSSTSDSGGLPVVKETGLPKQCDAIYPDNDNVSGPGGTAGSNVSLSLPRCYECNCPKLICDCDVDLKTGLLSAECSQGPYKCRWVRMNEMDEKPPDPCIEIPEDHECPVDCDEESVICDPECECDCCEVCECTLEDSTDYEDEDVVDDDAKGEGEEEETAEPALSNQCDLTDTSERGSLSAQAAIGHIVEEETKKPTTLAKIEGYKKGASVSSEPVSGKNELTDEEKHNESEEINKLIGKMI